MTINEVLKHNHNSIVGRIRDVVNNEICFDNVKESGFLIEKDLIL